MSSISKAIAAFLGGSIGGGVVANFLGPEGMAALEVLVNSLLTGAMAFVMTYFAPSNK